MRGRRTGIGCVTGSIPDSAKRRDRRKTFRKIERLLFLRRGTMSFRHVPPDRSRNGVASGEPAGRQP
jgi:hypothetical protein